MEDYIVRAVSKLIEPLTYVGWAKERVFIGYMLTSFLLAFFVVWKYQKETIKGFGDSWRACFPQEIWLHPSSKMDMKFFYINTIWFTTLVAAYLNFSVAFSHVTVDFLRDLLGPVTSPFSITTLAVIALTLTVALLGDFAVFLGHYLQHKVPILWEFHKIHHSARVMTPITVYRMHPVDDALIFILSSFFVGIGSGIFQYLFLETPNEFMVTGLNIVTFLFYIMFYNLRHSHIWVHYPGIWGRIFISPAQHQIHHSEAKRHWDKNFGLVFGLWDWMFGTLYEPKQKEKLIYGIGEETEDYRTLSAMYFLPFVKIWRKFRHHDTPVEVMSTPANSGE